MTIKELIDRLQEFDLNSSVYVVHTTDNDNKTYLTPLMNVIVNDITEVDNTKSVVLL